MPGMRVAVFSALAGIVLAAPLLALAKEAVKPLQDGLTKSFNDISKSMAA